VRRIVLIVALLSPLLLPAGPSSASTAGAEPGSRLWLARFAGRAGYDAGRSVATSPDGTTVFVTGTSAGTTGNRGYATLAYDAATGEQRWKTRYETHNWRGGEAVAMAVRPDGSMVFVTGTIRSDADTYVWTTVAYDATTGAQVWARRYGGDVGGPAHATALAVSPDGTRLFVAGSHRDATGSSEYATVAYSAATGNEVWVRNYDGRGVGSYDYASALAVSPGGETLFVTGSSEGKSYDYVTLAYDTSTGARRWLARYGILDVSDDEGASAIAVSPNGSMVFVTGDDSSWEELSGWVISATIAYDAATGEELWTVTSWDDPRVPRTMSSVEVSPDGAAVFVTGSRLGYELDYFTTAFDASSGDVLWGQRYDSSGAEYPYQQDLPSAMDVSPDGSKVFVTGASGPWRDPDYATVAYDASSGTELWVKRFQGRRDGDDIARAIVVSPDSTKVFVTGASVAAGNFDYVTIAYAT
jgi:outer membrane protein assembly factor BamB